MTAKLWSKGSGPVRDLVVIYYLGDQGGLREKVAAAAGTATVLNDTRSPTSVYTQRSQLQTIAQLKSSAKALTGADVGRVVLVGFSAGCQALRTQLMAGAKPDAVVAIDGTHASKPPQAWQLDAWGKYVSSAKAGSSVMVATHTRIVPPTFMSSREMLERITGLNLAENGKQQHGKLHVWSFPGGTAEAHISQAREVLPKAIEHALSILDTEPNEAQPWFGRRMVDRLKSLTSSVTSRLGSTNGNALGEKILAIAHHEKATVWEATGNNDGAVKKYFLADAIVGACTRLLNGKELKTGWAKGWEWCAASASWVIHHACAAPGLKPGVGRRIAVWELVRDAKELGTFEPATATPEAGWLVFFSRGNGNPLKPGQTGHVGIVLTPPKGGTIKSIDGNNGVAWGIADRSMSRVVGYARPSA